MQVKEFPIVDAQVHLWATDTPDRPWDSDAATAMGSAGRAHLRSFTDRNMSPAAMIEAMSDARVDGAIAVSPYMIYGCDASFALQAAQRYPDRFAVVSPVDPDADDLADIVAEWAQTPGAAGLRLVSMPATSHVPLVKYSRLYTLAGEHGVPLCVYRPGNPAEIGEVAAAYPDLQLVVDHLNMPVTAEPEWRTLGAIVGLAAFPNVALKCTGALIHSRQPYPFRDLWVRLHPILEAFGIERVMWGTDWTRLASTTYAESVDYFFETDELSTTEKATLMGANVKRIFRWYGP